MKKLAIVSLTFLFVLFVGQIQGMSMASKSGRATKKEARAEKRELRKLESSNIVSVKSKNSFYTDFGNMSDVKWRSSDYYDEAIFTKNGSEMTAFYDFYGDLVGTTQVKTFADVPLKGQKEIKKNYSDFTIGPVIFYDDNEFNSMDMLLYNTEFQDEDNYFVELTKGADRKVVRVDMAGNIYFFKQL